MFQQQLYTIIMSEANDYFTFSSWHTRRHTLLSRLYEGEDYKEIYWHQQQCGALGATSLAPHCWLLHTFAAGCTLPHRVSPKYFHSVCKIEFQENCRDTRAQLTFGICCSSPSNLCTPIFGLALRASKIVCTFCLVESETLCPWPFDSRALPDWNTWLTEPPILAGTVYWRVLDMTDLYLKATVWKCAMSAKSETHSRSKRVGVNTTLNPFSTRFE